MGDGYVLPPASRMMMMPGNQVFTCRKGGTMKKRTTHRYSADAGLSSTSPRRRGAVAALVVISLTVLVGMAALTIDVGYIQLTRQQLQTAADASSMAGAIELPNEAGAAAAARQFAELNHPNNGMVLADADILLGNWNSDQGTFVTGGDPINAVQVTTHRSASNGNPLNLFFARIFGISQTDVAARAIATKEFVNNPDCFDRGIVAGKEVIFGQNVTLSGYCAYGQMGVTMGQDSVVANGAMVGVPDETLVSYGQNTVGLPENIVVFNKQPVLANNIAQIIDNLEAGIDLPPQITNVVVVDSLTNPLVESTAYIVNSSVSIDQDYSARNIIIAVRGSISWGQNGAIRNTGDPANSVAIGLLSTESIAIGQDAVVEGVSIIAAKNVAVGQNVLSFEASIQAGENVNVGQNPDFGMDYHNAFTGTIALNAQNSTEGRSVLVQ